MCKPPQWLQQPCPLLLVTYVSLWTHLCTTYSSTHIIHPLKSLNIYRMSHCSLAIHLPRLYATGGCALIPSMQCKANRFTNVYYACLMPRHETHTHSMVPLKICRLGGCDPCYGNYDCRAESTRRPSHTVVRTACPVVPGFGISGCLLCSTPTHPDHSQREAQVSFWNCNSKCDQDAARSSYNYTATRTPTYRQCHS